MRLLTILFQINTGSLPNLVQELVTPLCPTRQQLLVEKISPVTNLEIELGENSNISPTGISKANVSIHGYLVETEVFNICMSSWFDTYPFLFIDREWLQQGSPMVNWNDKTIKVAHGDRKKFTLRPQNCKSSAPSITYKKIWVKQLVKAVQKGKENFFL